MKEKMNIYSYHCIMAKLINDPNTGWEYLLGEELYKHMKPEYIAPKGENRNGWRFNWFYDFVFLLFTNYHFNHEGFAYWEDIINMSIERIIKEGEEEE